MRARVVLLDQWAVQPIVKRIVAELQRREYLVWFDRKSLYVRVYPPCLSALTVICLMQWSV